MTKALLTITVFLLLEASALRSLAQSPLSFTTRIGTEWEARVYRPDGTGAGQGFQAGLFLVNGAVVSPLPPFTSFRTNSSQAAFYVLPPNEPVLVPDTKQGDRVTLRLRAWRGEDYDKADVRGESKDFVVTLSGKGGLPVSLRGLQSFTMRQVSPSSAPPK